jgi:hypothetical protein
LPAKQAIRVLIDHLAKGWRAGHADVARDFVHSWKEKVAASTEIEVRDHCLYFLADIGAIRLKGMDEVHCLMAGGSEAEATGALTEIWNKVNGPSRMIFLLALSEGAASAARAVVPANRCVVAAPSGLAALFESDSPLNILKIWIREQISIRRLIPFNIKNAVEGHMFFGRSRPLARFQDEDDVCFAVAGPGRIGKTSLLRRFRKKLIAGRDERMHSTYYIDCSTCEDRTPSGIARFIAVRIESSYSNAHLTSDRLPAFFRFLKSRHNRAPDLLLDEVDEIFHPALLNDLGLAAREQLCRLVFAGKGVPMRAMLGKASPLACRIDLITLDPLSESETAGLLIQPLLDLGFQVSEPDVIVSKIADLSGRLPHLVQYFGSRLAQILLDEQTDSLCPRHVDRVRDSLEATSFFMSPFHDLSDPRVRAVALSFFSADSGRMQLPQIREAVQKLGISLAHQELWDACIDLAVNNVLTLDNGAFRIANEGLRYYARQTGFFEGALGDIRADLQKRKVN